MVVQVGPSSRSILHVTPSPSLPRLRPCASTLRTIVFTPGTIMSYTIFTLFRLLSAQSCLLPLTSTHPLSPSVSPGFLSCQEMLLAIVDNSGPGFRGSEKFILAVRHYLCEALLLNSTSSNRAVMELSLKIFKPMCRDFKVDRSSLFLVFARLLAICTILIAYPQRRSVP